MTSQLLIPGLSPAEFKFRVFGYLGFEPHAMQREVAACDAPRRVLACGVRWGKTTEAAMEGLAASLVPSPPNVYRRGWVVASTYDLCDKVFREIALIARTKLKDLVVKISEADRILVMHNLGGGLSEIRGKSADNPDSLLGEGLDWLVVDEAARLRPNIWESYLTARLIDKKGWAILISTPKGKGWYYDLWRLGQNGKDPRWRSWNLPTWTNPHIDPKEIASARARVPDAVYRQEYAAEFLEGAGAVFRNVRELATGEFSESVQDQVCYAGLDLARVQDYTVLVIMDRKKRVVWVERFGRVDWSVQGMRLKAVCERFGNPAVLTDGTSLGDPVIQQLRGCDVNAYPYVLTQGSKKKLIDNLALALERREITLPKVEVCPELIDEVEAYEYSVSETTGNVSTGAPAGMHDDCVIALALATWRACRPLSYTEEPQEAWLDEPDLDALPPVMKQSTADDGRPLLEEEFLEQPTEHPGQLLDEAPPPVA